jgi:hypothetical protein
MEKVRVTRGVPRREIAESRPANFRADTILDYNGKWERAARTPLDIVDSGCQILDIGIWN